VHAVSWRKRPRPAVPGSRRALVRMCIWTLHFPCCPKACTACRLPRKSSKKSSYPWLQQEHQGGAPMAGGPSSHSRTWRSCPSAGRPRRSRTACWLRTGRRASCLSPPAPRCTAAKRLHFNTAASRLRLHRGALSALSAVPCAAGFAWTSTTDPVCRPQVYSVESADGQVLGAKALPVPIFEAPAHARAAPADAGAGARPGAAAAASPGPAAAPTPSLSVVSVAVVPPDLHRGTPPPRPSAPSFVDCYHSH